MALNEITLTHSLLGLTKPSVNVMVFEGICGCTHKSLDAVFLCILGWRYV